MRFPVWFGRAVDMLSVWLENLIAYSLQIAVIASVGALLLHLLRIQIPRVRLLCWQALIVACLLLPAIQPWLPWKNTLSAVQVSTAPAVPLQHVRPPQQPPP